MEVSLMAGIRLWRARIQNRLGIHLNSRGWDHLQQLPPTDLRLRRGQIEGQRFIFLPAQWSTEQTAVSLHVSESPLEHWLHFLSNEQELREGLEAI